MSDCEFCEKQHSLLSGSSEVLYKRSAHNAIEIFQIV